MVSLLFTYSGFLLIFFIVTITYLISSYFFAWIHPSKSQTTPLTLNHHQHAANECLKIIEEPYLMSSRFRLASSPLIITEENNLADIEAITPHLENNPDIYLINGFYKSILNETLFLYKQLFSSIINFHITQAYFPDLFRIEKGQMPLFKLELQQILKEYDPRTPNTELEKKFYSLFKSPVYKRFNYDMKNPKSCSLFSENQSESIRR